MFHSSDSVLLDVRSPGEFAAGHVPGSSSLPLFTDEERAEVGTLYVQSGRDTAVRRGLEIVGPKLVNLVDTAREILQGRPAHVMCWRGGMRSASVAWLLTTAGITATAVRGGYKSYRRWVLNTLECPWKLVVIAGRTGSAKTDVLLQLSTLGIQTIDLEALSRHKGSVFGNLTGETQPTTEQVMNDMAEVLRTFDVTQPVVVEDESRKIGTVALYEPFFLRLVSSPVIVLEALEEDRATYLAQEYASIPDNSIIERLNIIAKRLGGDRLRLAVEAIREGRRADAVVHVLDYYDRTYDYSLGRRQAPRLGTVLVDYHRLSVTAKRILELLPR